MRINLGLIKADWTLLFQVVNTLLLAIVVVSAVKLLIRFYRALGIYIEKNSPKKRS